MSGERRNIFAEETDDPKYADDRNFYKVEKWTRDGTKVDRLIYAGNSLAKAHRLFDGAVKYRPRIRLTIRQRTLRKPPRGLKSGRYWPDGDAE